MLKRNIALLIVSGLLGAQANLAGAGDSLSELLPSQLKYLEERAASIQAEARGGVYKSVKINTSTKYISAEHFGTLKIENDKGQSFVWTFDTVGEVVVPLKTIAPAGFEAGETRVYVRHPLEHTSGS